MRSDWIKIPYKELVFKVPTSKQKLKQKEYISQGIYPVIDQGQDLIGGYTNDESKILQCKLPVIVFGDHTKIVKLIHFPFAPGADGTKVLQPKKNIVAKYLSYLTPYLVFKIKDKGYARHYQHIEKHNFPLAPLPEQRAIVTKIEQLFSELDNGITKLKTAQKKLDIYRQSVLKKAFEGELTKEWRENKSTLLPTADELLEKIKQERQRHYEQQLADWDKAVIAWEVGGKDGRKPAKPRKISLMAELSKKEHLPILTGDDWITTKLEYISKNITDGDHQAPPKSDDGIPFITISNIKNNNINFEKTFHVPMDYYSALIEYRKPSIGDVLYTVTGSFGIPVIIDFDKAFCFQRHIGLVRPLSLTSSKWLYWLLQTQLVYKQALNTATGTAQKTVGLSSLRNFIVPMCSLPEQTQIVQEIESRLSVCDKLAKTIHQNLEKAESLRQSILKKAFEGRLLSSEELEACRQAPDWEPAEQLLARIQAEKAQATKKKPKQTRKPRKKKV